MSPPSPTGEPALLVLTLRTALVDRLHGSCLVADPEAVAGLVLSTCWSFLARIVPGQGTAGRPERSASPQSPAKALRERIRVLEEIVRAQDDELAAERASHSHAEVARLRGKVRDLLVRLGAREARAGAGAGAGAQVGASSADSAGPASASTDTAASLMAQRVDVLQLALQALAGRYDTLRAAHERVCSQKAVLQTSLERLLALERERQDALAQQTALLPPPLPAVSLAVSSHALTPSGASHTGAPSPSTAHADVPTRSPSLLLAPSPSPTHALLSSSGGAADLLVAQSSEPAQASPSSSSCGAPARSPLRSPTHAFSSSSDHEDFELSVDSDALAAAADLDVDALLAS